MEATWNAIHRAKNEEAYVLLYVQFYLCICPYVMVKR
jgi:hypothetical protein